MRINLLENEKEIVGEYLKNLDIGVECKIRETLFVEIGDPVEDDVGSKPLGIIDRFPQSLEVLNIYINGVKEKIDLIKGYYNSETTLIKSFWNSYRYLIQKTILRLNALSEVGSTFDIFPVHDISILAAKYSEEPKE